MAESGYLLVLVAAAAHAAWNAMMKGSGDPLLMLVGIRLVGLVAAHCFGGHPALCLRDRLAKQSRPRSAHPK
jgi:hypothetical protein